MTRSALRLPFTNRGRFLRRRKSYPHRPDKWCPPRRPAFRTSFPGFKGAEERGAQARPDVGAWPSSDRDRKSTRLNSSHVKISYAVFCLTKKKRQVTE